MKSLTREQELKARLRAMDTSTEDGKLFSVLVDVLDARGGLSTNDRKPVADLKRGMRDAISLLKDIAMGVPVGNSMIATDIHRICDLMQQRMDMVRDDGDRASCDCGIGGGGDAFHAGVEHEPGCLSTRTAEQLADLVRWEWGKHKAMRGHLKAILEHLTPGLRSGAWKGDFEKAIRDADRELSLEPTSSGDDGLPF
jgi:hypothetical protein